MNRRSFLKSSAILVPMATGVVTRASIIPGRSKISVQNSPSLGFTYILLNNGEDSTGWTDAGTVTWNYTTDKFQGTGSIKVGNNDGVATTSIGVTTSGESWFYCTFKFIAIPLTDRPFLYILASGGYAIGGRVYSNGQLSIRHGSFESSRTVDSVSINVWYSLWGYYKPSTGGSNGAGSLEFSTSETKLGSGNKFVSFATGGTNTANLNSVGLQCANVDENYLLFDKIRLAATEIPSNPQ